MANRNPQVELFMKDLEHPLKTEIERVRSLILDADKAITEQIKWKAPSFCYGGDDRVTFQLRPRDRIQLIFHRGAKVKDSDDFAFEDPTGLFEWAAKDRAIVNLHGMPQIEANEAALAELVKRWVVATSL
ncbi:DUF1801 domain-containing protein [bacterium]|nr:MAG: DUF1801 domain-containing protein [bacterium]